MSQKFHDWEHLGLSPYGRDIYRHRCKRCGALLENLHSANQFSMTDYVRSNVLPDCDEHIIHKIQDS